MVRSKQKGIRKVLRLKKFKLHGLRGKTGLKGARPMRVSKGAKILKGKTGLT